MGLLLLFFPRQFADSALHVSQHSGDDASKLASLLGLEDVVGDIAVSCDQIPINIIGVAAAVQNQCKSAPVCCDQTSQE